MDRIKFVFLILFCFLLLLPSAFAAASISISQSGADAGTVMLGKTFTVTVSSASANAQATITLPAGISLTGESTTKTTSNAGSVSWTTVTASQLLSAQTISVSTSGQGSPETVTSSSFNVITPPSLTATVSPTSASVTQGSSFTISLSIQNNGQTAARFGTITVSDSGLSVSSGCSPSDIGAGQSAAVSCSITASSPGSKTMSVIIAPSNADTLTKTVSVTVSAIAIPPSPGGGLGGGLQPELNITIIRGNATISIPLIAAGKMANVSIQKFEDISIRQLNISVINSVNAIRISILKLPQKPAEVTQEITGNVYHYINVTKFGFRDQDVNKVGVRLAVSKLWISENRIDSNTIILNRYTTIWSGLPTRKVSETADEILYEAESPGLSIFAISGQVLPEVTTPTPTPGEVPQAGVTPTPTASNFIPIIVVIIVVIALATIAVFEYKTSKISKIFKKR